VEHSSSLEDIGERPTIGDRILPKPLGILARAEPSSEELVDALHDCGFALFSIRSPSITKLYLKCAPDEPLTTWTDDRTWDELTTRLGSAESRRPNRREILQRGVTGMRSFVAEPMRRGRMLLAVDAAHIVPPTGAKGLIGAVLAALPARSGSRGG
jgi:p-hydroxybenzoate 3-monooxygenase